LLASRCAPIARPPGEQKSPEGKAALMVLLNPGISDVAPGFRRMGKHEMTGRRSVTAEQPGRVCLGGVGDCRVGC
jgi:hypothetical protein